MAFVGSPSKIFLFIFAVVHTPSFAFRRKSVVALNSAAPGTSEETEDATPSLEDLLARMQNTLKENEDDCPPDSDKCCPIGSRWQSMDFLRQSLGMGIEQCFQLNIDLAQAFATAALYVPIQIVFAAQGIYDFGIGAGSSGNALENQFAAERRKLTSAVSAAVQITIIPKALYIYVSMTFQVQAYQRSLDTHPYILSMKEIITLVTRSLLGKKYLNMRFPNTPQSQHEYVGSLLDMYTFTGGYPTDNDFLDRYDSLVDEASGAMTWPNAVITEEELATMSISSMRTLLLQSVVDLTNNFGHAFWNIAPEHHNTLFDCYTYYEAYLDTVYKTDIALSGTSAVTAERLNEIRKERDSYNNRYTNETFTHGFKSGGSWFNSRGKYKRRNADPLLLCDRWQDALKCRQRLALCLSLNYGAKDFEASELKGKVPPQFLNSFPEVVTAVNVFDHIKDGDASSAEKKAALIPQAEHALKMISQIQPTFMTLFRAHEGTVNACEVRKCSEAAGEEPGELIVEDLEDDDENDETDLSFAREVEMVVKKLMDGPWRDGLPSDSYQHTLYYAHAPSTDIPESNRGQTPPPKGLGGIGTCLSRTPRTDCDEWTLDVQEWGRSEQTMWAAILSKDTEKVKAACDLPDLQFHIRNPYSDGVRFIALARNVGPEIEEALRSCPRFQLVGELVGAAIHFRPYVVQRLWMRTVGEAHLAIDQHHKELKNAELDTKVNPTTNKAFKLEFATTVSFEATLDLNYVDFCKATGAPISVGFGKTWTGKLIHEYSEDTKSYVLRREDEAEPQHTKKFQIVMPDGSVKYFAEWGKGTTSDDFDINDIEHKYELHMASPGVMAAFVAMLGLSALTSKLSPLISRTITGEVVKEAEGEDGLTLSSLESIIARGWERQQKSNASSSLSRWFTEIGSKMVKVAQNQLSCSLGPQAAGMFLVRALTMNSISTIGGMMGTLGAKQAQNLYESAPVFAGAWFTGRLDMLVSHTAHKCHKMLRPQLKAFFRAGFNAPFVSGAYTAAFYIRISLPMTPKNLILHEGKKTPRRKQYCGLLGTPGRFKSCKELRAMFEILDVDGNLFLQRHEIIEGFNNNEAIADALLGKVEDEDSSDLISWKGFYKHFGFNSVDCQKVDDAIIKKIQEGDSTGRIT